MKYWMIAGIDSCETSVRQFNTKKEMLNAYENFGKYSYDVILVEGEELQFDLIKKSGK